MRRVFVPQMPDRLAAAALATALVLIPPTLAQAQTASERDAARQDLARQRAEVESRHQQAQAACYQRFVVTPCLNAARDLRRQQIDEIRRQENLIDRVEREEKARQRLSRIDQRIDERTSEQQLKAGERAARDAAAPAAGEPSPPSAVLPTTDGLPQSAARPLSAGERPAGDEAPRSAGTTDAQREQRAAQARARMAQREQQAEQRRRERDERLADPARPTASSLPLPR